MRLIDADNLEYDEVEVNGHWGRYEYVLYKRDIDASPTVDAVPVVRCKDCKYSEKDADADRNDRVKCKRSFTVYVRKEWFCANGEPKESGRI